MTKVEKIVALAALAMLLALGALELNTAKQTAELKARAESEAFGAGDAITKLANPVSTSVSMTSGTPTLILATSTARQYVAIVNTATNTLTVCPSKATCTADTGIRLNANGGSYEITSENLYFGAIYGVLSTSHASIAVYSQQ